MASSVDRVTHILVPYHLDEHLPDLDVPVQPDVTITSDLPAVDTWRRMAHLYAPVVDTVAADVSSGIRPIVQSGDCTVPLAVVAGMQRVGIQPGIVWFDGHGDLQTLETTTSGYIGGMTLRLLTGYRPELIAEPLGLGAVAEERIVLVDGRDLDPPEIEFLDGSAIARPGVRNLFVDELPAEPLYVHLDFDIVDPDYLPGLLFPAADGPSMSAVAAAVGRVLATERVVALSLGCTWHPGRGAAGRVRDEFAPVLTP